VQLETLSANERPRRFYAARGFERTGTAEVDIAGESYPATVYSLEL
jgi:hypothetical protein